MSIERCCVPNCNKTRADNTILHVFPNPNKDLNRFNKWINAIGGDILSLDPNTVFGYRRVCHMHFEPQYHTRSKRLSPNAVPTLHLSGFPPVTTRPPLHDVTNSPSISSKTVRTSDSLLITQRCGLQPSIVEPIETPTVQPGPSTSKGFSPATARPPLRDVTNSPRVSSETAHTSESLLSAQRISQEIGSQPSIVEPINTATVQPGPSTSKGRTRKSPVNVSPDLQALGDKIKRLQKAKNTAMTKLKKALTLSQNITFQKTLQKFTAAAVIFTMLQFREAGKKNTGRRFKKEEKIMALALYKQGPRAYRWLRKFFTLPSPLTLSRMIRVAALKPGVNENLFKQLKKKAQKMNDNEKLCILLFDEIALTPHFDYDRRNDRISGFVNTGAETKNKIADHALVFMMRGIYRNYKQPLSYSFCASTTPKEDLVRQIKNVIRKLKSSGFKVIATVCDQGATNVSAINYLINETRGNYLRENKEWRHSIFEIDGEEVIPLYDAPHLIKGIRNNLLTKDLHCTINGEEKIGKWEHILQLYSKDPSYQGLKLVPKLTERHVIPQKISKMKVKCATQIFSRTVAVNMGYLADVGVLPKECQQTADILLFFDSLFDSVNGSYNQSKKKHSKPLLGPATPKSQHKKEWTEAIKILNTMKFKTKGKYTTIPSVNHWVQTLNNMTYMLNGLSEQYGLTSVWMRHFNQDPLENFFGSIRSHGYRNTSPTCAGFEATFAALLINNLSGTHSPGSNCEEDSCSIFKSLKTLFFQKIQTETSNNTVEVDYEDFNNFNLHSFETKMLDNKIKAILEYVTGYVLRKLKKKVFKTCDTCNKCFYANNKEESCLIVREHFSNRSCLTYPSVDLVKCFSDIQDNVINIIRKDCSRIQIKQYIKTILSINIDYGFINCNTHKNDLILKLEEICVIFFLCNWCKDVNKLLKGFRTDFDHNDLMQITAVEYFKKRLKSK